MAGVITLLFTDLVGSTRLLDELGDDAGEQVRRTHFRLLRDAVTGAGGEEVKNLGDGSHLSDVRLIDDTPDDVIGQWAVGDAAHLRADDLRG